MKVPFLEKIASHLSRENSAQKAASDSARSLFALPAVLAICGVFAGYCASSAIESLIFAAALRADIETARIIRSRAPSFANAENIGEARQFAQENPFNADLRASIDIAKIPGASPKAIKEMTLRGTLPGVGAWIESSGATSFFLKGQDVWGFSLRDIKSSEVILSDGSGNHSLFMILSGGKIAAANSRNKAPRRSTRVRRGEAPPQQPAEQRPSIDFSGLEPASEGQEGSVPREVVNALLMNPYDELAKVRMVPTPDSSGMRLENLAGDSVLARVGVAQGDVISAINGVNITNVADASNALNSLMAGSRFDVTVIRDGKPLELRYQVK